MEPHHVDIQVGRKVRQCRWLVGMSLQDLADRLGISYQQLQKYEMGQNRLSISRLWEIARVLEVPMTHFLEGLDSQSPDGNVLGANLLSEKEAIKLVRAYHAIPKAQRRQLLSLAQVLSQAG